jgi:hypothetical protein
MMSRVERLLLSASLALTINGVDDQRHHHGCGEVQRGRHPPVETIESMETPTTDRSYRKPIE